MILRTIKCSLCNTQQMETEHGNGWPGWSGITGVLLDGESDVHLCPRHTQIVMELVDSIKHVEEIT